LHELSLQQKQNRFSCFVRFTYKSAYMGYLSSKGQLKFISDK